MPRPWASPVVVVPQDGARGRMRITTTGAGPAPLEEAGPAPVRRCR
ncbi:MAG: hypothetical protein LBE67_09285 [Kocuria palustris]|nr:hypothetical protein [Kocuria palustris]